MSLVVGTIMLACAVVVLAIVLRVWAAITRGAVSLTNTLLGGRDAREADFARRAYDLNPIPRPQSLGGLLIPVPDVFYAILINVAMVVVSTAVQCAILFGVAGTLTLNPAESVSEEAAGLYLFGVLAAFPAGVLVQVVVLKMALPTTFIRAGVVWFFQFLLSLLLAVCLGLVLVLLAGGFGNLSAPNKPANSGWVR